MKIKHLLTLGCAAFITSCADQFDDGLDTGINTQGLEININGGIDQQYISRVDDGGFCDGDQIGLYGVNYTADNTVAGTLQDKGNQVDNVRYTFEEETRTWKANSAAYYKDVNTHIDLYAYYPYGTPGSTSAYEFAVQKDQNNNGGYAQSDFLWAQATDVVPSENKVQMHFTHRMAGVRIILKEGTGFAKDEFPTLKQSAIILNTKQESTINIATGEVTAAGAIQNEGILMMNTQEGLRAIVVPQTVKTGTPLFAVTLDGMSYQYKHNGAVTYQPGKQIEFTMKVNRKQPSGTYEFVLTKTEIVDWVADTESHGGEARQYYVVHQEKPGTLGELIRANKKNPNKIKNLKVSGKINANDFYFMRDSMEILQAINLKESTIEACSKIYCNIYGDYPSDGHYEYFDKLVTNDEALHLLSERYPNASFSLGGVEYVNAYEIPNNAFENKSTLTHFSFPEKVTKIGNSAFCYTLLSGALIIPDDVTIIGQNAFYDTDITSLTLPNQLKEINEGAFYNCKSLSGNLNLPESLTFLGGNCFGSCSGLSGVLHIPHQIKSIPSSCFNWCENLTGLILPDGLESIGDNAFWYCSKMSGELNLPQSLKEIGEQAFYECSFQGELIIPNQIRIINYESFRNNDFSSIIFPDELIKIESRAFYENQRLCEPLLFPETLLAIDEIAFAYCTMLPKIILPSQLATIQSGAFNDCYSLSSIISKAKTPPNILGSAFDGVAKDNFTVEVPEGSVVKYQTSNGWSEFKRINAHHDFSISRSMLRALNAEYSHSYTLRVPSGQAWSIREKPDWITVTPASGVGKTDVTIKVSKMDATEDMFEKDAGYLNGRAGEIVFLLDEKNYTSTMKVEQYNSNRWDGEVITHQTATKGDGVNIVFMGDCFDALDIYQNKYTEGINEAIEYFFAVEPYKTYRDYFNVYTVMGMSPESGTGTVNTIREAKFGSQYSLSNGIVPNESLVYEYACKAPTVTPENIHETLVVLIENTQDYGGLTYMWSDGSAIAVCPMSRDAYPYDFRGLVQHEAGGHGFGKLADEYIYTNGFIQSCSCGNPHVAEFNAGKSLGWYDNLSLSGNMNEVPWSHLIYHPTYSNIVDMYEGGYFHTRGVYRSEATSCMNNNIPYFSAISRESIVKRIMDYANEPFSQDDFYAKDVLDAGSRALQQPWTVSEYSNYIGASKQYAPKLMKGKPVLK